jgi:hypothetical protein
MAATLIDVRRAGRHGPALLWESTELARGGRLRVTLDDKADAAHIYAVDHIAACLCRAGRERQARADGCSSQCL